MALLLISNGPGRLPVVETVKSQAEALARFADDPSSFIIVEGRVLEVASRTVTLLDGQPVSPTPAKLENADDSRAWQCAAAPGTPGEAEHSVDVAGGAPGEPGSAPSEGAGERPDSGGAGTSQGTGAGQQG